MGKKVGTVVLDEEQRHQALGDGSSADVARLTPSEQALLRLADVFLTAPAAMDGALRQELAATLSSQQVVEAVLRLAHYSVIRVRVGLALDITDP
jgi:alkylhydroperoxidase family enzyme